MSARRDCRVMRLGDAIELLGLPAAEVCSIAKALRLNFIVHRERVFILDEDVVAIDRYVKRFRPNEIREHEPRGPAGSHR